MKKLFWAVAFVCFLNVLPVVAQAIQITDRYFVSVNGSSNLPFGYGGFTQSGIVTLARTIPTTGPANGVNPVEVFLEVGTPMPFSPAGSIHFMTNSRMKPYALIPGSVDMAYVTKNGNYIVVNPDPRVAFYAVNSFNGGSVGSGSAIANGQMKLQLSSNRSTITGTINVTASSWGGFVGLGEGYNATISGIRLGPRDSVSDFSVQNVGKLNSPTMVGLSKTLSEGSERLTSGAGPCDQQTAISFGQSVNGQLNSADCQLSDGSFVDFYSFNGTQGQQLTITMNSAQFDTYLIALGGNNFSYVDDDGGGGTNSRMVITLPSTGTYFLAANSFDSNALGNYSITLAQGGDSCSQATTIIAGQTLTGQLTASDCRFIDNSYLDYFAFSGRAGQRVTISMNSTQFDTYLMLSNASGFYVLDDDDGDGTNSRIVATLPSNGTYAVGANSYFPNTTGNYTVDLSVAAGTKPAFDFDGDTKADVAVFRPSSGAWYLSLTAAGYSGFGFGQQGDKIVPADYDGDGKADLAVFRSGIWYLQRSQAGFIGISFGAANDIPAPADYDGDGKADLAVFRPGNGTWYLQRSQLGFTGVQFGQSGDKPVPADYDGDGKTDLAVNRSGTWYLQRSQLGFTGITFGDAADKSVPADYDGDGKADVAVFRPSNGTWYLNRSQLGFTGIAFGLGTDLPAAADYDGDGKADVAVFRAANGTWYLNRSQTGFTGVAFGANGDVPVPNAFAP